MTGYRNYGGMEPQDAIARYRQRKADDARTPLDNAGELEDELGTDDESDSEPSGGALGPGLQNLYENAEFRNGHPTLHARLHARSGPTGLSRADEIAQRTAALVATGMTQQAAAAQELAERDQIAALANDPYNVAIAPINASLAQWNAGQGRIMQQRDAEDAPDSPGGGARYSEPLSQSFGGEGDGSREDTVALFGSLYPGNTTVPGAPDAAQAMRAEQSEARRRAVAREEQRRAREEWEAVMAAARARQRDRLADGSVDLSGTTEPFPGHQDDNLDATQPGGGALDFPEVAEEMEGQPRPYPWDERSPHAMAMQQVNDGHIARMADAAWRTSMFPRMQEDDLPTDDPDSGYQTTMYDRRNWVSIRNALERHRRDAARMQRDMEAHQGPYGTFEGSAMQETLSGGAVVP